MSRVLILFFCFLFASYFGIVRAQVWGIPKQEFLKKMNSHVHAALDLKSKITQEREKGMVVELENWWRLLQKDTSHQAVDSTVQNTLTSWIDSIRAHVEGSDQKYQAFPIFDSVQFEDSQVFSETLNTSFAKQSEQPQSSKYMKDFLSKVANNMDSATTDQQNSGETGMLKPVLFSFGIGCIIAGIIYLFWPKKAPDEENDVQEHDDEPLLVWADQGEIPVTQ